MFEFDGGLIVQMNSSWCVRVNRDELFELQVDGTHGSAVAGLRECKVAAGGRDAQVGLEPGPRRPRRRTATSWIEVPVTEPPDNGFKLQWELFLRHVVLDEPFRVGLRRGRARRAALRAGRAVVARAALGRRAGADAVSHAALPRAGGVAGDLLADRARAAAGARRRAALAGLLRRRARGRRPAGGRRPDRAGAAGLGGDARLPPAPVGARAAASPRRWTPRSAAWGWTGPRRRS